MDGDVNSGAKIGSTLSAQLVENELIIAAPDKSGAKVAIGSIHSVVKNKECIKTGYNGLVNVSVKPNSDVQFSAIGEKNINSIGGCRKGSYNAITRQAIVIKNDRDVIEIPDDFIFDPCNPNLRRRFLDFISWG